MKFTSNVFSISMFLLIFQIPNLYPATQNVIILNSYHEGYHWTDMIMKGVKSVLSNQKDIDLSIEYMDTKRLSDPEYLRQLASLYEMKYKNRKIDAILSSDDYAMDFLIEYGNSLFQDTPVVFCGITDFHPSRIAGYDNFTGIYEAYDVPGTISLMHQLHPNASHIAVILDDTLSGESIRQWVLQAEKDLPEGVSLQYLYKLSSEDLEQTVRELPSDSLILWGIYLRTAEGRYISSRESLGMIRSFSNLPIYCVWDVLGQGVVGGKITNPVAQGQISAEMILEILNGRDVGSIPVVGSSLEYLFDYRELERFGISEEELPSGSTISYKPFSILHEYRFATYAIIIVLMILTGIIAALVWDIHMRNKAEKALHLSQLQLAQSRKMDAIGQLAGGIAHDFNNILTGIMGAAEVLQSENRNQDELSRRFIDIILKASQQASDLTAKLLAFGRKGRSLFLITDIHQIIDDSLAILSQTLDRNIEIISLKGAVSHNVLGSKSSLQNVLMNLVINSSQAMSEGGCIRITTSNIELDPDYCKNSSFEIRSGLFLDMAVVDTGSGISREKIKKIFEPFYTTKGEGSGLGLSAVYGSVQDHHGAISIQSEVGKGTDFHIFLPVSIDNVSRKNNQSIKSGSGTILLIDDDKFVLTTVKQQLEDCGYSVYTADGRSSALDLYQKNIKKIDIVILDMIMPKTSGREIFYELRGINPECKIIIFSGYVKEIKMENLWEDGLCGFLQKPYKKSEMIDLLHKHI